MRLQRKLRGEPWLDCETVDRFLPSSYCIGAALRDVVVDDVPVVLCRELNRRAPDATWSLSLAVSTHDEREKAI